MTIQITQAEDHTLMQLSGALTIAEAQDTHSQFIQALANTERLTIDLSGVTEVDLAGLQLLMCLPREKLAVSITNVSEPLRDLFRHLNLLPYFGLEH